MEETNVFKRIRIYCEENDIDHKHITNIMMIVREETVKALDKLGKEVKLIVRGKEE